MTVLLYQSSFVWSPCTPWGYSRDGGRSGVLISGHQLVLLTVIPVEPLALAFSVHQTSTHGFRQEQDVSKLVKRDGEEEVKPSTQQRSNGSVQTGPHLHCCWAEKVIRKYPLKNSFSCLIL